MLAALLGEVKGLFGRVFVIAGLLPAALVVFGWTMYDSGLTALEQDLTGFLSEPNKLKGPLLLRGLALIALALVLYAGRGVFLTALRGDLPGRWLTSPLRQVQLRRARKVNRQRERAIHEVDVVDWAKNGFGTARWAPPSIGAADVDQALNCSADARAMIERSVSAAHAVSQAELLGALVALNSAASQNRSRCTRELTSWRALQKDEEAGPVLADALADLDLSTFRCWTRAFAASARYPSERWIEPTTLGNRYAALDEYASCRYGIDTTALWTRLWGVLSKDEKKEVTDGQLAVELGASFTIVFAGLFVAIAVDGFPPPWHLRTGLCLIAAAIGSFASYRAAIFAMDALTAQIVRCVDLRRHKLISELGLAAPKTFKDELTLFEALHKLFVQGVQLPATTKLETTPKKDE